MSHCNGPQQSSDFNPNVRFLQRFPPSGFFPGFTGFHAPSGKLRESRKRDPVGSFPHQEMLVPANNRYGDSFGFC